MSDITAWLPEDELPPPKPSQNAIDQPRPKTRDVHVDCRARIAELEAHAEHDEDNIAGLEHALVRANQRYTQAEAERDALRAKWCGNCLSLETCYIADKATELDDYEEQRVRCDFWAECEGGEG